MDDLNANMPALSDSEFAELVKIIYDKTRIQMSNHKRALVFGTGGASKAVEYVLSRLGIEVQLVSRQAKDSVLSYEQITPEVLQSYQLLVNATPLGTFPHVDTCVDIPYQNITNKHLLYDLVYNPQETLFLRYGKERGAQVMNGYAMLRGQAEAAWGIWNKQE